MTIRIMRNDDRAHIERILRRTEVFTEIEIQMALDLVDTNLSQKYLEYYRFHCAVDYRDVPIGFVCFGQTPLTEGTFDLYWIAVDPEQQRCGLGDALLLFVEAQLLAENGRMLMIETSSQPKYAPTHHFYLKHHYREVARIPDFYSEGDDRVIYQKLLREQE